MSGQPNKSLASILAEWNELTARGETPDIEGACEAHPDLATELRAHFEAMQLLQEVSPQDGVQPLTADTEDRGSRARLRPLPHDRYVDFRPAGLGGMGIVYWALDTDLNRQVAFKVVRPDVGSGAPLPEDADPLKLTPPGKDTPASKAFETLKARFLTEAWVTGGLEHPGIVPVYELGETDKGVPYYTMRFVRGERTLEDALNELEDAPLEERLSLLEPFLRVCDTIHYAHAQGVIHRDLKPQNVALGSYGEVVVLDWGLAKLRGREDRAGETWQEQIESYREAGDLRTEAGALGTPGYMSPEAALGRAHEMDARSDVYSLGAMLYRILTGKLPHSFRTYAELIEALTQSEAPRAKDADPSVPEALSSLCAACLDAERSKRPESAEALARGVRGWQVARERDRERDGHLREAETALEAAEADAGAAALRQLDRALAATRRAEELGADAATPRKRAEALRERAIRERESQARQRTLLRTGIAAGTVLLIGAIVAAGLIDASRKSALDSEAVAVARSAEMLEDRGRREVLSGRPLRGLAHLLEALRLGRRTPSLELLLSEAQRSLDAQLHVFPDAEGERLGRFDPSGEYILTCPDGQVWRTEDRARVARVSEGPCSMPRFSGDGSRLLVVARRDPKIRGPKGRGVTLRLCEFPGGREVSTWTVEREPDELRLSADGKRVLISMNSGPVELWDAAEGRRLARLAEPWGDIQAQFHSNGKWVAVARKRLFWKGRKERDGYFRVFESHTGSELLGAELKGVTCFDFHPTKAHIALWHHAGGVQVLDLASQEILQSFEDVHHATVTAVYWTPDGEDLLTVGRGPGDTAVLWPDADGNYASAIMMMDNDPPGQVEISQTGAERAILLRNAFSDWSAVYEGPSHATTLRGRLGPEDPGAFGVARVGLALAPRNDSAVGVWDTHAGGGQTTVLAGHDGYVTSVDVHPSGDLVLTSSLDGTVRLWSITKALPRKRIDVELPWPSYAQAVSTDGERVLYSRRGTTTARGWKHEAIVWDVSSNSPALGVNANVLALSPDGRAVLVRGPSEVFVHMIDDDRIIPCQAAGAKDTADAQFTMTGDRIVLETHEAVLLLDAHTGRLVSRLEGRHPVSSPDGRWVATTVECGLTIWRCTNGAPKLAVELPQGGTAIGEVTFDGASEYVVADSDDDLLRVWNIRSGQLVQTLEPKDLVTLVPGGSHQVITGEAGRAVVWNVLTGKQVLLLPAGSGGVVDVQRSPEGTWICTTDGGAGAARVWDADSGVMLVEEPHAYHARFVGESALLIGDTEFRPLRRETRSIKRLERELSARLPYGARHGLLTNKANRLRKPPIDEDR